MRTFLLGRATVVPNRILWKVAQRVGYSAALFLSVIGVSAQTAVKPNRTLPAFEAHKSSWRLPENPTTEELFRSHVFQEPLVPVGGEPTSADNSALAAALLGYTKRNGPDDFASLTQFLEKHPDTPWRTALLTDLGLEYYNTAHYSLALEAWSKAWSLAGKARDAKAIALVQRAFGELIKMDSRLGRMDELERLLNSIGNQPLPGPAGQRVVEAREALWFMQHHPEVSFRCGPLALRSIQVALNLPGSNDVEILKSASTQQGCALPQVAELSRKIGLNYQMAFRASGEFVAPSVIHWKVGHYAALMRKAGDRYELQDPTFGNKTWATREALEAETSGYFLVPGGPLPAGWRAVDEQEGAAVWGKGLAAGHNPQNITRNDLATGGSCPAAGMAAAKVHLMEVNLNLADSPVGYGPPVGPTARFVVRYNRRDVFQPANFSYGNLGPQWTSDWFTYITDNPSNVSADVNLYVGGGGQRTYTGFDTNTQSFAYQQYDNNLLTRTGPASYQLLYGDGSRLIFSQSDGSIGGARNIFLTQEMDPQGNALTFIYDTNLCLTQVIDAIGQVTTLAYGLPETNVNFGAGQYSVPADPYKLTQVTDPFGRSATFSYQPVLVGLQYAYIIENGQVQTNIMPFFAWLGLASDTDVIGITSQFGYQAFTNQITANFYSVSYYVNSLTTPYGTTTFTSIDNGDERSLDTGYPDGSVERVEYHQVNPYDTNYVQSDPALSVPTGMATHNFYLLDRDTYYWSRTACAMAYKDYTKARVYHFCHDNDLSSVSGVLESLKQPLENRVWFDYAGQLAPNIIGTNTLPLHIGRVLDDGTTQLHTYGYNGFGQVTNAIDPLGRTISCLYDTNGIDLLEVRQTRAGNNELLAKAAYNSQHCPLTATDSDGQTTTFTYNARGQILTDTDPKNEITTFTYDTNGYLLSILGPLPGTNDVVRATYDAYGRVRTTTDESGYTLTFDYDNLDRVTRVTHPDGTFSQFTYNVLDLVAFQDRAGRQTMFAYDNMRQVTTMTDPLGRVTHYEWCRCGAPKSVTDPMGRRTSWLTDVQGRQTAKEYADGSQVRFFYENTTSRLRQMIDEKQQATVYTYNLDNTLGSIGYVNTAVPTPSVTFAYDPNYQRVVSMTDGVGTTTYGYIPITTPPVLGAGALGNVSGPLTNEAVAYSYDELGRVVQTSIDGILSSSVFDALDRTITASNELGFFAYAYDGASQRLLSESKPNGLTASAVYGSNLKDFALQQLTYTVGASPVSQFTYGRDIPRIQITNWSQQAGAQIPSVFTFGYDAVNQLLSAVVTNSGAPVNPFAYSYDPGANRLSELAGGITVTSSFNALNQLSTAANAAINPRTNLWDGQHRLASVSSGNRQTVFGYDGMSRLAYIQQLQNGSQTSFRRFVWCDESICEERDATGTMITKRYFPQGVLLQTGTNSGPYYYTRDHLGSIRELTDASGNVRARYTYDPFGRQTKVSGDVDADYGFARMFWSPEANLALTHFRAYDPNLGRWLSRDPLPNAELRQGPNLYVYVANEPIGRVDPAGLAFTTVDAWCARYPQGCYLLMLALVGAQAGPGASPSFGAPECEAEAVFGVANAGGAAGKVPVPGNATVFTASVQSAPGMATAMRPYLLTQVPGPAGAKTIMALEDVANAKAGDQWWEEMMMATSDYRNSLARTPNGLDLEPVFAHARLISKMHDLLFHPSGR